MRILLIAYDYPPTQSPRALRWRYLSRELAMLGHEVHVLIPDLGEPQLDQPQGPGRVVVHASFPGPFGWLVRRSNRKHSKRQGKSAGPPFDQSGSTVTLNWRGAVVDAAKRLASFVLFPDVRAEWTPWARRRLRWILAEIVPHVVISSHEPATTLLLGMYARNQGFTWLADLGDPVRTAYTPRRWRRHALKFEALVCRRADRILVTNGATRDLLVERHGQEPDRFLVLPNGYDDRRTRHIMEEMSSVTFDEQRLELIYAGRLYDYRNPAPLLQAVAGCPGVRLTLIVPDPPPATELAAIAAHAGSGLRVLGALPHVQVQQLLERADILVNFGDRAQPVRTPAKLYEYFGVKRPILHVHSSGADAAVALLHGLRRGWICLDDENALRGLLADLCTRKQEGVLYQGMMLSPLPGYAHSSLGLKLEACIRDVVGSRQQASSRA